MKREIEPGSLLPQLVLLAFSLFLFWTFSLFLHPGLPAVDLPGHIAAAEGLARVFPAAQYYDFSSFTGYAAFQSYSFLAHFVGVLTASILSPVLAEPALERAMRLLMVLGASMLPESVYFAARPLTRPYGRLGRDGGILLALTSGALALWFLHLDYAEFGIGAEAIFVNGLYPQLFGWHLFLLYLGYLLRTQNRDSRLSGIGLCITTTLLLLSHQLSAFAALAIGAYLFLLERRRWRIFWPHVLGAGLAAFWLLPSIVLHEPYSVSGYRPWRGDILGMLFRYPPWNAAQSVLHGVAGAISATEILLVLTLLLLFSSRRVRSSRVLVQCAVLIPLLALIFSSEYVQASLRLPLHYYRFQCFLLLLAIVVAAAVPLAFLRYGRRARLGIVLAALLSIGSTMYLPNRALQISSGNLLKDRYTNDREVLHFLTNSAKGRVLFEYFDEEEKFPFLAPHFMCAELSRTTAIECANGLFVMNSLAWHFIGGSAWAFGMHALTVPPLFAKTFEPDSWRILDIFREVGISHVVVSTATAQTMLGLYTKKVFSAGPYAVFELSAEIPRFVSGVKKSVVGYIDHTGMLPFKYVEMVFFQNRELREKIELIDLTGAERIPEEVSLTIENGGPAEGPFRIYVPDIEQLDHYRPLRAPSEDVLLFGRAKRAVEPIVRQILARLKEPAPAGEPELRAVRGGKGLLLRGLVPGKLVRIDYSFAPFWWSDDGEIYRGSVERMFLLPTRTEVKLSYEPGRHPATRIGLVMTGLSAALLIFVLCAVLRKREEE